MSISKGSLKRVNEGGLAHIGAGKEENDGIHIVFQQIPIQELELDDDLVIDSVLMESIKKWTILVPLIVYVDKSNKLTVISGKKRLKIAKELEMDVVPCQLIEGASEAQIKEIREELEKYKLDSIHEEKFRVVSSLQTKLPDYLL